jgi:hypothetical protein
MTPVVFFLLICGAAKLMRVTFNPCTQIGEDRSKQKIVDGIAPPVRSVVTLIADVQR